MSSQSWRQAIPASCRRPSERRSAARRLLGLAWEAVVPIDRGFAKGAHGRRVVVGKREPCRAAVAPPSARSGRHLSPPAPSPARAPLLGASRRGARSVVAPAAPRLTEVVLRGLTGGLG